MRKSVVLFTLASVLGLSAMSVQGCYGSFGLTKKVYKFNGSLGNKWINSLFTFVLGGPVYVASGVLDAVIFNLIEFWTGSSPVAAAQSTMDRQYADGTRVHAERLPDGRLSVQLKTPNGVTHDMVLRQEENGISMTDAQGRWLASATDTRQGTVLVTPQVASAR